MASPRLLAFFLASLLEQLLNVLPVWLLLWHLEVSPSLAFVTAATVIAQLSARIPLSIGGVGVQEASLAYILVQGGVPAGAALLTAVAVRIIETLCCVPWWLAERRSAIPARVTLPSAWRPIAATSTAEVGSAVERGKRYG